MRGGEAQTAERDAGHRPYMSGNRSGCAHSSHVSCRRAVPPRRGHTSASQTSSGSALTWVRRARIRSCSLTIATDHTLIRYNLPALYQLIYECLWECARFLCSFLTLRPGTSLCTSSITPRIFANSSSTTSSSRRASSSTRSSVTCVPLSDSTFLQLPTRLPRC